MIAAIRHENWAEAKAEMLDSDYAEHDTPGRAEKNADVLLTGQWPGLTTRPNRLIPSTFERTTDGHL
jgi:hypothetical protein